MDTTAIRQQLHNYLDVANDKKVKAIYVMVEDEIKELTVEYTDAFKAELDRRVESYINGGKVVAPAEINKRLKEIGKRRKQNAL